MEVFFPNVTVKILVAAFFRLSTVKGHLIIFQEKWEYVLFEMILVL